MPQKKVKVNNQNRFRAFLKSDRAILMVCISIAFVFWLFTKMSYVYKSTISVELVYELPEGKVLTIPPPKSIDMDIEGTGWDLIGTWFRSNKFTIDVNLKDNAPMTLNAMNLKSKIGRQLSDDLQILELRPDFVQLLPEGSAKKKIPVRLDNQIELAGPYQYEDSIQLEPAFITVSGPASVVGKIKDCKTVPVIMQNVEASFEKEVALKAHPNSNIVFEPNTVKLSAKVEQVTEKRLEINIEKRGAPDSLLLVLLPKKIEVICIVGLSDYESLNADEFEAVVDFREIDIFEQRKIKVKLERLPSYIRQIQFQPTSVDYIIRSQENAYNTEDSTATN
jgi:YbbR domain-containing protein